MLRETLITSANEITPNKISEENKRMYDRQKRDKMSRHGKEYRILYKEIKNKCRQTKEEWLNEK